MIYTVTLNPAIDYIVSPKSFEKGEMNRYSACTYGPGGKGVNVSLLLTSLGEDNIALGTKAGFTGEEIVRLLEEKGCKTDFIALKGGHSRLNMKICRPGEEETDINGDGPELSPKVLEAFEEKMSKLTPEDTVVLAGSLPPSLPEDTYARLLAAAKPTGALAVVDACGGALLSALKWEPFLIKPNAEELGEIFSTEVKDLPTAKECAFSLQRQGARNVLVSMGERGALLVQESGKALFCHAVRGETISTVGAGDSMVAGILYGLKLHGNLEGALRWGAAAGAATAFARGVADGNSVKALYPRVGNPYPV